MRGWGTGSDFIDRCASESIATSPHFDGFFRPAVRRAVARGASVERRSFIRHSPEKDRPPQGATSSSRIAMRTRLDALLTPSLRIKCDRWLSTVRGEMWSTRAISLLARPSAMC